MRHKPVILHLVDDTTAGGVMRVIECICGSNVLANSGTHRVHRVTRGRFMILPDWADIIVSHTTISWRSLPALIALRASHPKTPLIHVEHSYTAAFVSHNVTHNGRFSSLLKAAFSLFDRVVAVSHAQANWMTSRKLVSAQRLTTIQSCVDLTPFHAINPAAGPIKTFGAIGRLDQQKGFDMLINAFKALPDPSLRLKIFGTGPEEQALRETAAGDGRIEFMGFCTDPSLPFKDVDAVVMPSRWEAFGLVAIEARAAGRRLLCSRVDGLMDHASLGTDYFNTYTKTHLAAAMSRLAKQSNGISIPNGGINQLAVFQESWNNLISEFADRAKKASPAFLAKPPHGQRRADG
ncbi:MAG: glycosyltransferase family 4 protein [Pacificibacter sp.]|uniref:glycosyltransferase family 4 protein n=1 Tax=Pacificibacter sp. TaxID=1917866 RepID=UPI003219EE39